MISKNNAALRPQMDAELSNWNLHKRQLILTRFSSKATLTDDGILEKEDTFPDC